MTGLAEVTPLTGRDLRRLTRAATESHGGGAIGDVVGEVYTFVFSLLVAAAMAFGASQMLSARLRSSTADVVLDPAWLGIAAGVVATGAAISLAGRLGPVGLGGGQAAWLLPTPVDRRGLLRPRLTVVTVIAAALGLGIGALAGTMAGASGADIGFAAALGGTIGLTAVLAVARTQVSGSGRAAHPAVAIGEGLVVAAPLLAIALVLLRPAAPAPLSPQVATVAAAVLLVVAVFLHVSTERHLDDISGAQIRARGAVTAYAAGAVTSLDTRELGRALSITSQPDARRRSRSFGWVRGPVTALVSGDALVTLRSRRHVIAVLVWAVVPIVVTLAGWASWTTLVGVLVAGYASALALAEGARRAEMAPVLDRAFPIAAEQIRRIRLIWPGGVMLLWTVVTVGSWAWLTGLDISPWLPLAAAAGPVFAAGAIRGAYRKPADWSKPLVANPMGPPIPPGLFGMIAKGPDIVVICLVPLILGIVAVASPVTLLPWQLAATLIAIAIGVHVPNPQGAFAQAMAAQGGQAGTKR
ncbi:DUF6297 family protein [Pseudactinotalea suaedae]|uniref:DUF6297 family protein n=1 Tax=Pseudactinotalea suaedae TaxID=1524924 RepID=UPI0012E1139B|nr:DUF6297 family protein [Pseudactinotalea suaedae]